jgi:hypothetical protein
MVAHVLAPEQAAPSAGKQLGFFASSTAARALHIGCNRTTSDAVIESLGLRKPGLVLI